MMAEPLFDEASAYDGMLDRGLRLTGESKNYFARRRVTFLKERLGNAKPESILDFGCGLGATATLLHSAFEGSRVFGCDRSEAMVEVAEERHASPAIQFGSLSAAALHAPYDLVYANGVFHHIRLKERAAVAAEIRALLTPRGSLALFENNPFNPGTRIVMRRIPFDRDAELLSPRAASALLRRAGFDYVSRPSHLFVFPAFMSALRPLERHLEHFPLGGQYCLLASAQAVGGGRMSAPGSEYQVNHA